MAWPQQGSKEPSEMEGRGRAYSLCPSVSCEVWGRFLGIRDCSLGPQLSSQAESPHLFVWCSSTSSQFPKQRTLELSYHTSPAEKFSSPAAPVTPQTFGTYLSRRALRSQSLLPSIHIYTQRCSTNPHTNRLEDSKGRWTWSLLWAWSCATEMAKEQGDVRMKLL